MPAISLTRQQKLKIKKLASRIDRVTQADRRFFERRPDRQHRVRIASQAEIEANIVLHASPMRVALAQQHFIAVRKITPWMRMRLPFVGPRDADTDLNEETARKIFDLFHNDETRGIEHDLRVAFEVPE